MVERATGARDPVCGMRVDEWTAVHSSEYASRRYFFCSQVCLDRFQVDPAVYVSTPAAAQQEQEVES